MLCISNPSVTSVNNLAEFCGSNKKNILHAVKWFLNLVFWSILDPMESTEMRLCLQFSMPNFYNFVSIFTGSPWCLSLN